MLATLMHVLHVIDSLGLGGAERMLIDIANATHRDGHRVSVCITRADTTGAADLESEIEVLVLARRSRLDPKAIAKLVRWLRHARVDVLHVHMRSSASFVLLLRTFYLVRIPIVFHDHFGTIETDTTVPAWFRFGNRGLAAYVGVYERLAEWARRAGMPQARVYTIENRLDLARLCGNAPTDLRRMLGVDSTILVGVLVATLRPPKGVEVAIQAAGSARARKSLHLAIVGAESEPAYAQSCRALVLRLGLEHTVSFLGPRSDVPNLLAGADFGMLSSHSESGPLVLIEYARAGLPFIATRVGDIGRRLDALGVPGFVDAGDVAAFSREIDVLISETRDQRVSRGATARVVLDEEFDLQRAMPRWYQVYQAALKR